MTFGRGIRTKSDAGFSLLELLLVCVLVTTMGAVSAGVFRNIRATVIGNTNIRKVETLLKLARETAINERRAIVVTFTPPNRIRLTRLVIPTGTVVVADNYLENNMSFMLFTGMPDTPESFGRTSAIDFGAATQIMFTSEGRFTDAAGTPINGTVFLGRANTPMTARALTVFGPTSTLRSYRWNGSSWRH